MWGRLWIRIPASGTVNGWWIVIPPVPRDLVAAAHENLHSACCRLAQETSTGAVRQFGPLTAACAGVSTPIFNQLLVFEAPPMNALSTAVAWMRDREVPFWVTVADPVLEGVQDHLATLDLVSAGEQPGMVMSDLEAIPSTDTTVEITEVTTQNERAEFSTVTGSAFGWPPAVVEQVDRAAFEADGMRLFLGHVDGQPAASGLLIRSGDVAGVYSIGVLEDFRRRGLGNAMTQTVLRAGREAGCQVGVLQSSEMGHPLYDRMGFETVVTYHHFEPAE